MNFSQIDDDDQYESNNQPRQRLRSWLTNQLDIGQCPGCRWLDYDRKIFKLTWKHYGRPGFDQENDAKMFREWALHTRRWSPGDPPDVSTWKTRFRNALHKMPDIEEMHAMHELEGSEPFRVYRFRSPSEVENFRDNQRNGPLVPNAYASNQSVSTVTQHSSVVPMIMPSNLISSVPSIASSFLHKNSPTQNCHLSSFPNQIFSSNSEASYAVSNCVPIASSYNEARSSFDSLQSFNSHPNASPKIEAIKKFLTKSEHSWSEDIGVVNGIANGMNGSVNEFEEVVQDLNSILEKMVGEVVNTAISVTLSFADREILTKIVNSNQGVRIAYKAPPPVPIDMGREAEAESVLSEIYGNLNAEQIYYPPGHDKNTQNLLEWIQRGLLIMVDQRGDIYAKRLCQAKVFYAKNPMSEPKGLVRSEQTLLWSFEDDFLPQFKAYKSSQIDMAPSFELVFSFGQKWTHAAHLKEMLIHCSLTHLLSRKMFKDFKEQKLVDVQISTQDHFDILKDSFDKFAI